VIEREQAHEQLDNTQRRFEDNMTEMQQRVSQECNTVRRAGQNACQQLEVRVMADCQLSLH